MHVCECAFSVHYFYRSASVLLVAASGLKNAEVENYLQLVLELSWASMATQFAAIFTTIYSPYPHKCIKYSNCPALDDIKKTRLIRKRTKNDLRDDQSRNSHHLMSKEAYQLIMKYKQGDRNNSTYVIHHGIQMQPIQIYMQITVQL